MYIYSNTSANLLFVVSKQPLDSYKVLDKDGNSLSCPKLSCIECEEGYRTTLDASALAMWTLDCPTLYTFETEGESVRFGHTSVRTMQDKMVLFNDAPIYLRGFIRGIVAHDHPNMTGLSDYEAAVKNIKQAKKYGFNLVRFHSTVPSEDFMRAADELGMLVHLEIGFLYERDSKGNKINFTVDNEKWLGTIDKYRNCPSLAIICIGNEMHNSGRYPEVRRLYNQAKTLAPTKLVLDNSGWGEYDRTTSDVFSQHIAYFFPFKSHKDMFKTDVCWHFNGSAYEVPMTAETATATGNVKIRREATPLRPVLAHEAMHYIDIPDYQAMNDKFDAFAEKVGPEYLEKHSIKKPAYLTEMPKLIERKGLTDRLEDYQLGSRAWKNMAMKIYMEEMRLSKLCGFEMLQFSDCLKYENKNGIVDFFDDDKFIDSKWFRQMNDDLVLLADLSDEIAYDNSSITASLYASDFLAQPEIRGDYKLWLDDELVFDGKDYMLAGGLQKLATVEVSVAPNDKAQMRNLRAEFVSGDIRVENQWKLWFYPTQQAESVPTMRLQDGALKTWLEQGKNSSELVVTDTLDEAVFSDLDAGKTVVLFYEYDAKRNTWQMPGALERFKPCIWDRGSNLGGIISSEKLQKVLGSNRYFDMNLQPLLEAGTKVNLDSCPFAVTELFSGIDKPVRDRMKGLKQGIKHFIDEDTLRKFSHLFSVQVGNGTLIVCTLNVSNPESPVVANLLSALVNTPEMFKPGCKIEASQLRQWLETTMANGLRREDTMNHFWELDDRIVEDTLFWEEVNANLAGM
ncbi:MAG: hypothetical protein IJA47_02360 [Oscillospiraceae bacterium]|nr:hypothetical protein [Oscillospiraceae bacterium]